MVPIPSVLAAFVFAAAASADQDEFRQPQILLSAQQTAAPIERPEFDDDQVAARRAMVRSSIRRRGIGERGIVEAMRTIPRHEFVPEALRGQAYQNRPLPIGHGQTISQPQIVGYMTEQMRLNPGDRVLEIGTGSGYHAAVVSWLADHVVSIEIVEPLARSAASRLRRMGFTNITVLHGDGYFGYPDQAPYDAILVTAAAPHVPPPLIDQLKPGGRMVIPVGRAGWTQNLLLVQKDDDGRVRTRNLTAVQFVPLTREQ